MAVAEAVFVAEAVLVAAAVAVVAAAAAPGKLIVAALVAVVAVEEHSSCQRDWKIDRVWMLAEASKMLQEVDLDCP